MERTIYLLVAYEGTEFHGFQVQPGFRSVQGILEQAIRRVVRHQVNLVGSGRTDAGVHAAGHVSHFVTSSELPTSKLRHAIGSRLPKDVSVLAVREVHPAFDARRSAISKLYRYRVFASNRRPVEHKAQRYTYHVWHPLELDRIRAGARYFVGRQDFSAMAATGCARETMVRTVIRCDVERHFDEIRFDVEGDGFLYKQVRNMIGTLITVGCGQWPPERVAEVLETKDRANAGATAPARGLCMQWVRYPPALLRPPEYPGDETPSASVASV